MGAMLILVSIFSNGGALKAVQQQGIQLRSCGDTQPAELNIPMNMMVVMHHGFWNSFSFPSSPVPFSSYTAVSRSLNSLNLRSVY